MLLNYQQILKLPIYNQTKLEYKVSARYASKNDITGYFHISTEADNLLRGEVTLPSTEIDAVKKMVSVQGDNGKRALKEFDTIVTLPVGQFTVYIQNNSEEDFFLDRIEFIHVFPDNIFPFNTSFSVIPGNSPTIRKSI
ncbi:delta endotoxin C-terminal domain-containing protein [Bacillus thuringiensis]|uniref:delta endotoxin C-terminal domain-containing protein n=1 Tax=Bacillus thuringiensis TaxID=1428 RepID=UPI001F550F0A|nr:delta endotoxin C-terminal domain-containing protein [Bacillus thuringiensis]